MCSSDLRTGWGLTTHLYYLSWLPLDWDSPWGRTWLATVWPALASSPRRTVRLWVLWLRGRPRTCPRPRTRPLDRQIA